MPLCHWPCCCYPNHSLGQVHDWMSEIYERWTLAHGIIIVTPVYWYQAPSAPDPEPTQGEDPALATKIQEEMRNIGRAVATTVRGLRDGTFTIPDARLEPPRPK